MITVRRLVLAVLCRALDLLFLLPRPRLVGPYFRLWFAEWARDPYVRPRSFETVLELQRAGHQRRELTYGETPLWTAVLLLKRAGLSSGHHLFDLGAGRGRVLLAARWLGARATGVELQEAHVRIAKAALEAAGAELRHEDVLTTALEGATHVFLNWCSFSVETRTALVARLAALPAGTSFVAVSGPAESRAIATQREGWGVFTWGIEKVFFQQVVPPVNAAGAPPVIGA